MTKIVECMDVVGECDFQASGDTVLDVLERAAAHAKNAHNIDITAEFVDRIRRAIRET